MRYHNPDLANDYCDCGRYVYYVARGETVLQTVWVLVDDSGNAECDG